MADARYPLLSSEEQARLSKADLASYQAKRRAFAREVEAHCDHIAEHGWLDVATDGKREVRFAVPVTLKPRPVRSY